jgi:hypothetical protein
MCYIECLRKKPESITADAEHIPLTNRRSKLKKTFGTLFFAVVAFLAMPSLAMEVQSDGLMVNTSGFIDSHFEFTEVDQAPLTLTIIENTVTAITLAQNRTMDSANSDNRTQTVLTFDSVAKLSPSRKFEVGWQ